MKAESTHNIKDSTAVPSKFKDLLNDKDFLHTTLTIKLYFIASYANLYLQVTIKVIKVN